MGDGLLFYGKAVRYIYGKRDKRMIYLLNQTDAQAVYVPKNGGVPDGDLAFKAKSTMELATEVDAEVLNLGISDLYVNIAVTLPEGVPNGEYEYSLTAGGILVSSGLLVIGDTTSPDQYNHTITYEQFEAE